MPALPSSNDGDHGPLSFEDLVAIAGRVGLTPRELELFLVMFPGKSYKEAAAALRMNLRTARFHFANIRAKFGAESQTQIILRVWQLHQESHADT